MDAITHTFRPATNADRAAVEQLVFTVLAEYGLSPDPSGTDADLQDIQATYTNAGGTFELLLDEADNLLGTVALFKVSDDTGELRKMYLAKAARGYGLGRRLLEHALTRAAALGFRRVELETATVLREAVALYERYGFRPFTPAHLAARCDCAYYLNLSASA